MSGEAGGNEVKTMQETISARDVSCDLCGSDYYTTIFPADAVCGPIVRCRRCDLVYANPQMTVNYESKRCHAGYLGQAKGKERAFEYRGRMLAKFRPPGKLLEIGAHHEFFLQVARRHGWEVLGIEPDAEFCEWAKAHLGVTMLPGFFENIDLEPGTFDAVVFFNVLEHMVSPTQALERSARLLKAGGVLFVEVPNIHTLSVKLFGKRWFHFGPGHYFYFLKKTMRQLMEKTGFEVLRMPHMPKYMRLASAFNVFANHMPFLGDAREAVQRLTRKVGLDGIYFRLQTRDFLGA
jgi:2-polyprenyl-3-methyl-5-hydroxy-6-metoxy-1,4-benzoquinol methylase